LADQLAEEDGISIKVGFSSARGYFFNIPSDIEELPPHYIQAVMHKKTIACTTIQLDALSCRTVERMNEMLEITNELIQSLLQDIRNDMDSLFSLVDSIVRVLKTKFRIPFSDLPLCRLYWICWRPLLI
jgi:DNA mismatch repair ATPase MutS